MDDDLLLGFYSGLGLIFLVQFCFQSLFYLQNNNFIIAILNIKNSQVDVLYVRKLGWIFLGFLGLFFFGLIEF